MYPRVSIHLKTDSKHKTKVIAVPVLNDSHFTALHRSLRSHGIAVSDVARREMRMIEMDEEQLMKRVHLFPYESWEFLIYEEHNITSDKLWCTTLLKLSRLDGSLEQVLETGEKISGAYAGNSNTTNEYTGEIPTIL